MRQILLQGLSFFVKKLNLSNRSPLIMTFGYAPD